jgi:sulfoxide reductase heme-binding subunit YedZ
MRWCKDNWRWAVLNLTALVLMLNLVWQFLAAGEDRGPYDLLLVSSGKWAIRFLLLSLLMTPLNTLLGWRSAVKLRKPAGLWAFGFAAFHLMANIAGLRENWLRSPIPDYIAALGVTGLSILMLMAATSTRWAMKHMGKWWKRLHRWVYAAGIIVVVHAWLEAPNKRVAFIEPQVALEIALYGVIVLILLAVRIPVVRHTLAGLGRQPRLTRPLREDL